MISNTVFVRRWNGIRDLTNIDSNLSPFIDSCTQLCSYNNAVSIRYEC